MDNTKGNEGRGAAKRGKKKKSVLKIGCILVQNL